MNLQKLTTRLQGLCHDGHSQLEVAVLDADMHEHYINDVKLSPNRRVWLMLSGDLQVFGGRDGKEKGSDAR